MIPLFEEHPLLKEGLGYVSLAELPTPVQKLNALGARVGIDELYVKRDDISGKVYGGNKTRKLEFILGQAVKLGASRVMTFGAAGSNHALATAIYSSQLNIETISILSPQPNAHYVRRNLLMGFLHGAELHLCGAPETDWNRSRVRATVLWQMFRNRLLHGEVPSRISPGGSSPRGVVGFVNAALELRKQISDGAMPAPDCIYVACGSMGTAAGLMLGLRAVGLPCRVVSVAVTGGDYLRAERMFDLIQRANTLLRSLDASFPQVDFSESDVDIRREYFGSQYGLFTREGMEAVSLMRESEGIELDGTYTGKALAAVIGDARSGRLNGKTVLFWNTLNSRDFSDAIAGVDYHELPREFHRFFEEPVQPLDAE